MLNLSLELLRLFAEGVLTATAVQRIAAAAGADGWGVGDTLAQRLQQAGAHGKFAGNCQRDLLRAANSAHLVQDTPEPYFVTVPGANQITRTVGVSLPHEQFHMLVQRHGLDAFRLPAAAYYAAEGLGGLLRAWGAKPEIALDTRDVAVFGFHADGVSYTSSSRAGTSKSVLVASWNVVSAGEPCHRGRRCLFFCLNKALCCNCGCEGFHTWNPLFQILAWSLGFLVSGQTPICRHDGSPWTEHDLRVRTRDVHLPRAALLMVRGDWEWLCQCFRFRHYQSESFCWLCAATHTGHLTYYNVRPDAPHTATKLTHAR